MNQRKLKVKNYWVLMLIAMIFIYGCSSQDYGPENKMMDQSEASLEIGAGSLSGNTKNDGVELDVDNSTVRQRKLIKEAIVRYHKDSLQLEVINLKRIAGELGGFVSGENLKDLYNERQHFVQIKVTNDKFETFMERMTQGVTSFEQKDIHVQDVTNEFFDLEARIASEKKIEIRYQSLLSKAHTIEEIIQLEELIGKKRVLIESFEGKMKVMDRQVAFSTINITVYKPIQHIESVYIAPTFTEKFVKALSDGWSAVLWFVILIVAIWPFYIVLGILLMFLRYLSKRKKSKITSTH
jgi:hypothetical protein